MDLSPWEHFNQEYLTPFGGLARIQCSALVLIFVMTVDNRGADNGSIGVKSGKKPHRMEATYNGNRVKLFN